MKTVLFQKGLLAVEKRSVPQSRGWWNDAQTKATKLHRILDTDGVGISTIALLGRVDAMEVM